MEDKIELLLHAMREEGKPMKASQIIAASGLDKKEADKVMKVMKKEGLIVSPKRCFWEPADAE